MNREEKYEDLIELGVVSAETKGSTVGVEDYQAGLIPFAGLSDE